MVHGQQAGPIGWRKSSFSGGSGGDCVEVAQSWRKSSYRGASGGECVEVAGFVDSVIPIRDSKDTERGFIAVPVQAWATFTDSVS